MILVKRVGDSTSQKVVSMFMKRAKKYNIVARKRKTQNYVPPMKGLALKRKAVRKAQYLEAQASGAKLAKKI